MGTPVFATTILKKLVDEGITIRAVVTAPDRKSGRGQKVNKSDVKMYAEEQGLPILQPTNLKDHEFTAELQELKADLFVVVAFRMLPEIVWTMPPKGTINLHASLLPNYRGAAPINWAVINGETTTGVSTFFIEKEIDTGMIIEQEKVDIGENENAGELHDRLMHLGAKVVYSTIKKITADDLSPIDQTELMNTELKAAPKIFKPDCEINFSKDAQTVHNFCRGLSPYPASWCTLYNKDKNEQKTYKLFSTEKTNISSINNQQLSVSDEGILFPCSDTYLLVKEIQPEGKRKMHFKDFLAGNSIKSLSISTE
tara:strand:+ start:35255 stop:36190 length:936 start_codon:yes stop_codon:yes gene_type:complete